MMQPTRYWETTLTMHTRYRWAIPAAARLAADMAEQGYTHDECLEAALEDIRDSVELSRLQKGQCATGSMFCQCQNCPK